jgi:dolichol-phosphate mannosyltransferase
MKYTLVIAAYNEANNIGPLTSRLIAVLDGIKDIQWELIYVIEGTDDTRAITQSFADQRPEIRILYNEQPSGLGNAFRQGFAAVPPDTGVVITMDADLNHQPEEIPRLTAALFQRNADIVIGSRKMPGSVTHGAPFWKTTLSNVVNAMIKTMIGMPVWDQTSGYRAYRYAAFQRISFDNTGFAFLPEILLRAHALKMKMVEEPITFIFRVAGESKMRLIPTARSYTTMLLSRFRTRPHSQRSAVTGSTSVARRAGE